MAENVKAIASHLRDEDARPSTSATPTVAPAVPSTAPSSPATRPRRAASAAAVSSPPVTRARRATSAAACRGSVAAAAIPTPARPCRTSTGISGAKRRATELQNEWHDISVEDVEPHQFPFCPQRTPGVQLDVLKEYSPLELFQLFFSKEAITVLCHNTNNNGQRKKLQGTQKQWIDVDSKDMLHYLSIVIYQGLIRPHSIRDLWRTDRLHNLPCPVSVMPGYRYEAINACLHMSDPAADILNDQLRGQAGYDGLFRVKPLQDQILTACRAFYHPHQNLAIDERMVATKVAVYEG
ncbi:hypothetical protein SKAU_G00212280 [Synaphobranchus kaupii]|uniref:PiggyBac transposable element-derived protein domain-containing protein n=1 Tax=Synaphobranchus kaupii TaxID=118154 RepID=A0A9Q1F9N9_SYNKA|nr:hypothetical protein SKAU_G00212280 [Synaphobranchus kaupii]